MHIVLFESSSVRGFDCVKEMSDADIRVTFVTSNMESYFGKPGAELMSAAAQIIELPVGAEPDDIMRALNEQLGTAPLDGVICREEAHAYLAACLARDRGLPHEEPDTVRRMINKATVRKELDAAGLGRVRWSVVGSEAACLAAAADIGYPVVVKPVDGGWSIGVSLAWSEHDIAAAFQTASTPIPFASPRTPEILVEEYIVGRHVSAEMLVQDERVILLGFTERVPAPAGTMAELGGVFPARFPGMSDAGDYATAVVKALNLRCSAVHVEMLMTPTGPALIEMNPRVAGHILTQQMSLALNRSIALDLVDLAVGRPVLPAGPPAATASLRQLFSWTEGTVSSKVRDDELEPAVAFQEVWVEPGERVRAITTNQDRFGFVVARGETAAAADAVATRTTARILADLKITHPADAAAQPTTGASGPHLSVLCRPVGDEFVSVERVLEAVSLVTDRVTVIWISERQYAEIGRHTWSNRALRHWHHAQSEQQAESIFANHVADADGVLAADPGLDDLACRLRGSRVHATPTPSSDGELSHTVVLLQSDDAAVTLGLIDEARTELGFERRYPSILTADIQEQLVLRAVEATRASGVEGVVRCSFAHPESSPTLRTGIDASTTNVLDAVNTRSVFAMAAECALGRPPRRPSRRAVVALHRSIDAPSGAFRVVRSTENDEMYSMTGVFAVDSPLTSGETYDSPTATLRVTVTGDDVEQARMRADAVENAHELTVEPADRTHLLLLDRVGPATWTDEDGEPLFPRAKYRLSVLTAASTPIMPERQDFIATVDVTDSAAVGRLAAAVHSNHPVHRVATVSERLLEPVARLRRSFGVTGAENERISRFIDKAIMKQIAHRAGIRQAPGGVLSSHGDVMNTLVEYGVVVVKPRRSSGSQGVSVLSSEAEAVEWSARSFRPDFFVCEQFVTGVSCHIDALVTGSRPLWNVSRYSREPFPLHLDRPISSHTSADPVLFAAAEQFLLEVIDAWEIRDEVLHLEAFWSPIDGFTFCELASRPGGGGIVDAFRATRGINLDRAKLLIDAGDNPKRILRDPIGDYAGFTVHYAAGGVLRDFDDSAVADKSYVRTVNYEIGQTVRTSAFSGSGISTHVFVDDDPNVVTTWTNLAENRVRIDFDDTYPESA